MHKILPKMDKMHCITEEDFRSINCLPTNEIFEFALKYK